MREGREGRRGRHSRREQGARRASSAAPPAMGRALLCVLADWRSAGSHLQPPPPPSLSPPRLQADVDAAIQKLQDLKLDREAKLKVWGGGGGGPLPIATTKRTTNKI